MKREDLAKLFKLHATILGIGFGAAALGLGYMHYKDNRAEAENTGASAVESVTDEKSQSVEP